MQQTLYSRTEQQITYILAYNYVCGPVIIANCICKLYVNNNVPACIAHVCSLL